MAKQSEAWKSLERNAAKKLDGKRVHRGGNFAVSATDIDLDTLPSDESTWPEAMFVRTETKERLTGMMLKLKPREFDAIVFRYIRELSHKEIGERFERTSSLVGQVLARALSKMRHPSYSGRQEDWGYYES